MRNYGAYDRKIATLDTKRGRAVQFHCVDCGAGLPKMRRRCLPCTSAKEEEYRKAYHARRTGSCVDCGAPITATATRCQPCALNRSRAKKRPPEVAASEGL